MGSYFAHPTQAVWMRSHNKRLFIITAAGRLNFTFFHSDDEMQIEMINIELSIDPKTEFPCVRLGSEGSFVSVLPVTKFQVEQWSYNSKLNDGAGGIALQRMIERMEMKSVPREYPPSIKSLSRVDLPQLFAATLPSIIATNLRLWSPMEEIQGPSPTFPTEGSEWGRVLRWLRGRVPSS